MVSLPYIPVAAWVHVMEIPVICNSSRGSVCNPKFVTSWTVHTTSALTVLALEKQTERLSCALYGCTLHRSFPFIDFTFFSNSSIYRSMCASTVRMRLY